ncbi:hypothetical protein [uncultured Aquimarina sp.]|uniref:hypothetical protein n=1 Tax=uncultured Aquimarina sp. TaxID=575652 RepID=UPI00262EBBCE|nr:hypothetical protein [uncultured Aquimarina sp.]
MKKKQLNVLSFKKEVITRLEQSRVKGGKLQLKTGETENYCTRSCSGGAVCVG